MSNFISMSWTLLLKKEFFKICWAFGRTMYLLVKLRMSKSRNVPLKLCKAMSKWESMSYISVSLNVLSCNTQDLFLEDRKAYKVTSTTEYKFNSPTLIGKEGTLHWMSPKKGSPPTKISLIVLSNSLSNQMVASSMWIDCHILSQKSLMISTLDWSERISLCGPLNYERRWTNSTSMTTLFMNNPLIKILSWLTTPIRNFIPNTNFLMS